MQETVTLEEGLTYGGETATAIVLREPTAGDVMDAQEAAERPVALPGGGFQLMVSQTRLGYEILRRQVLKVGSLDGPVSMAELRRLSPGDLERLDAAAQRLDAAGAREAGEEVSERGRDESAPGGD